MKLLPILSIFLAAAALAGEADVTFVGVDKYADGVLAGRADDDAPRAIELQLKKLSQKYLPANRRLLVQVTDLDLAGAEEWRSPAVGMVRVLRDVTPPALTLHYQLRDGDKLIAEADARVVDLDYLHRINPYGEGTAYRYEKQMLEDWFRRTFQVSEIRP
jgi:hypothetical protein